MRKINKIYTLIIRLSTGTRIIQICAVLLVLRILKSGNFSLAHQVFSKADIFIRIQADLWVKDHIKHLLEIHVHLPNPKRCGDRLCISTGYKVKSKDELLILDLCALWSRQYWLSKALQSDICQRQILKIGTSNACILSNK